MTARIGRRAALLAPLGLAAGVKAARAQPWSPPRSVRLVVPYAPGGGADTTARLLAVPLAPFLGQPVVVENRPGAGSTIGAGEVARAAPDGTSLLLDAAGHTMAPFLIKGLPFDYATGFTPISQVLILPQVVAVRGDSPYRTLEALLARAKAEPGRVTWASSGNAGMQHITGLLMWRAAGLEATHVPYRGGAPAMQALLAGDVDCVVATITSSLALSRQGRVRPLAATSARRIGTLPEVPTLAELGFAGFDKSEWNGVFGPAGLPAPAVARLQEGMVAALQDPVVRERLEGLGAVPLGTTPAEFAGFLARERETMAKLVQEAGITAD